MADERSEETRIEKERGMESDSAFHLAKRTALDVISFVLATGKWLKGVMVRMKASKSSQSEGKEVPSRR